MYKEFDAQEAIYNLSIRLGIIRRHERHSKWLMDLVSKHFDKMCELYVVNHFSSRQDFVDVHFNNVEETVIVRYGIEGSIELAEEKEMRKPTIIRLSLFTQPVVGGVFPVTPV